MVATSRGVTGFRFLEQQSIRSKSVPRLFVEVRYPLRTHHTFASIQMFSVVLCPK